MAQYSYEGFSSSGQSVTGTVEALNERLAFAHLSGEGITPVRIAVRDTAGPARAAGGGDILERFWNHLMAGRVPSDRLTQFIAELATMLKADVPLLEAIRVLGHEEPHLRLRSIVSDVEQRVQKGESFSHALAAHPRAFPMLLVTMVRVGETGGQLGQVLEKMAGYMEHQQDVRGEVRAAMVYPCVVIALAVLTIGVLVTVVLPKIQTIFVGMKGNLPLPTRLLLGLSAWMEVWWWTLPLIAVGVGWLGLRVWRTETGRRLYDRVVLHIPIMGGLVLQSELARFASACASLLATGVPLLETLKVVRGLLGNSQMRQLVDSVIERVTRGLPLARALGESPWFPEAVTHLLSVGERTGRLGEMFDHVAERFEKQTRLRIRVLINLISPLMIVALAIGVGVIAASILLPIYRMNDLMR